MSVKTLLQYEIIGDIHDEAAAIASEEQPTPLADMFLRNPEQLDADEMEYFVDPNERRPAPLNQRGAPPKVLTKKGGELRRAGLVVSFNEIELEEMYLHALREPDSHMLDRKGRREIRRQMVSFLKRQRLQEELFVSQMLFNHKVYRDSDGNIVASSSTHDIDFEVPSSQRTNIGGIIGTAWDNAAAPILGDLRAIDQLSQDNNAPRPTMIIAPNEAKEWIRGNTEFQTWTTDNNIRQSEVLNGDVYEDFGGKTWHFFGHSYQDTANSDTITRFVPTTKVAIVPEPRAFMKYLEGLTLVPRQLGVFRGIEELESSIDEVYGQYSYAKIKSEPLRICIVNGKVYGAAIKDEYAVYAPTVDF